jgi:hypothetical protein
MQKKCIVRLTVQERNELVEHVKKLKGSSQKVRRAQILLKADVEGPNWTTFRGLSVAAPLKLLREGVHGPLLGLFTASPRRPH